MELECRLGANFRYLQIKGPALPAWKLVLEQCRYNDRQPKNIVYYRRKRRPIMNLSSGFTPEIIRASKPSA